MSLDSLNLKDIKIDPQRGLENLLDLRRMNIGLRELSGAFHVPKDWVLLERTILLLYGCCSLLDPELNPVAIIQPYLQDFVLGNRDFAQIAIEAVRDMAMSAMTLPEDMRRYLTRANRGELEVRVRGAAGGGPRDLRRRPPDHLHRHRTLRGRRGARVVATSRARHGARPRRRRGRGCRPASSLERLLPPALPLTDLGRGESRRGAEDAEFRGSMLKRPRGPAIDASTLNPLPSASSAPLRLSLFLSRASLAAPPKRGGS